MRHFSMAFAGLASLMLAGTATAQHTFHGSARVLGTPNTNTVFLFDVNGNLFGNYADQPAAAAGPWGYRDGATNSNTNQVYFGDESGLYRHEPDGTGGTLIAAGGAPGGVGIWRALAFDPTGNGGAGSLWVANFGSALAEVSLTGALLGSFPAGGWSLYGLSYDDLDGNLWGHDTAGTVIKINTATGTIIGGSGWPTAFANLAAQGGLSGFNELGGRLAAISQGTPDELGVYDLTGALVQGPINVEGQSGTNGHLGVAVTIDIECWILLGLHPIPGGIPLPWSPGDPLYVVPEWVFDISLVNIPLFPIPNNPLLAGGHIYSQIYMDNPVVYPGDQFKMSNGLDTVLGGNGTQFGINTGMQLWLAEPAALGGQYRVGFSIN